MKFQVDKNGQGVITVPKTIWTGKNWKDGTVLDFKFSPKGEVILKEQKSS